MTKHTATMSGAWSFHDKTHCYYVWCLIISWQNTLLLFMVFNHFMTNRLIICLVIDHFMKKHTYTMSGACPFHDKTHCYYAWCFIISWQNTLLLCLVLDHFMTNRLILCLVPDHCMTKHTSAMSGAWPLHDKRHCYYVWCLTIHDNTHCYSV
jgi:hypothetical protein